MKDTLKEIETLCQDGMMIQAIKLYRELTGLGLKESKEAVEHFIEYRKWPDISEEEQSVSSLSDVQRLEAMSLNPAQKIRAIKLYRELTGGGLKESKEAVEHFSSSNRWPADTHLLLYGCPIAPEAEEESGVTRAEVERLEAMSLNPTQKIRAIKLYRELTGGGLKDSKEAIEHFIRYKEWSADAYQLLYERKSVRQIATGADGPSSTNKELLGMRIDIVAQQGESSPISKVSSSLRTPKSNKMLDVLTTFLGYTPAIVAEISATKNLETGMLILSTEEFFFCSRKNEQWRLEEKWSFSDVLEHHFSSSFMGAELQVILNDESVRFVNIAVEESEVFIRDFVSLRKANGSQPEVIGKPQEKLTDDPTTMETLAEKDKVKREDSNSTVFVVSMVICFGGIYFLLSFFGLL